eukprot:TRINITY_DN63544_c0_g1_i3.p1 TRINITY_DN63544_c0_g1~~TRINITY_DN63544_c0_g1_i3.p1  ORF type:complete len:280 (+),score=58.20 TRINITY_DN63544_c0_g1_i3:77-916(+)
MLFLYFFFFQAEDGIRDAQESRGLGDVYKRQSSATEVKRLAWQIDPTSDVLRDFPALNNKDGNVNMEVRDFIVAGSNGLASDESQLTPHQQAVLARERTNWKLLAAYHGVYAGVGINPYVPMSGVVGGPSGTMSQVSNAAASAFAGGARNGPCPFMPTIDLPLLTGPLTSPMISAMEARLGGVRGSASSSSSAVSNNLLLTLDKLFNPLVQGMTDADTAHQDTNAEEGKETSANLTPEEGVAMRAFLPVSYTHLRAHETPEHLVCRLLLEKKKNTETTW